MPTDSDRHTAMPEWLSRRAAQTPHRPALICEGGRFTFADLDRAVNQATERCLERGVRPGEHVGLLARNSLEYVIAFHAVARAKAVLVPINTRLSAGEIENLIGDARVRTLFYDAESAADVPVGLPGAVPLTDLTGTIIAAGEPERAKAGALYTDLDAVQSVVYTSGTTGKPKGALLTYGNHWWSATGSTLNLGLRHDDVWLACLPLFHVGGMAILMRNVICGTTVLLHRRFDAGAVNHAIDTEGVTHISVVSTMLQRMLDERHDRPYPKGLRCVLTGGGPVPKPLLERCAVARVPVVQTYGLTETASQAVTLSPEDALRKLGSAGKPLFPVEIEVDAPAGDVGEIRVRGPNVSPGYFNKPRETQAVHRNGWLHTGDLGFFDEDGYLFVVARRRDLIVSGGENVYPAEVESVLEGHPAIAEAAVVPVDDTHWGQVPVALVVLSGEAADERMFPGDRPQPLEDRLSEALRSYCRGCLAGFKRPVAIYRVADLPRNATGKLLRHHLPTPPVRAGAQSRPRRRHEEG